MRLCRLFATCLHSGSSSWLDSKAARKEDQVSFDGLEEGSENNQDERSSMTDQEHEQRNEETSEDREETMKDLDVPEEEGKDVKGGVMIKGEKK